MALPLLFVLPCSVLLVFLAVRVAVVWREIRTARRTGRWRLGRSRSAAGRPRRPRSPESEDDRHSKGVKALVVLGSGGHTTEILALIGPLLQQEPEGSSRSSSSTSSSSSAPATRSPASKSPHGAAASHSTSAASESTCTFEFVYCKAKTDTTSAQRLPGFSSSKSASGAASTSPRSQQGESSPPPRLYDLPRSREVGQSYVTSAFTTLHAFLWSLYLVWYEVRPTLLLCNGPGTCLPLCAAVLLGRVLLVIDDCPVVFVESLCRVKTLSLTGKLLYPVVDLFAVHWTELRDTYPQSVLLRTFVAQ